VNGTILMEQLVIDKGFWDRGRSNKAGDEIPPTCLIGPEGMCCLGFYGIYKGISPEKMLGIGDPAMFANNENDFNNPFNEDFFGGILHSIDGGSFKITTVGDNLVKDNDSRSNDRFTEFDREIAKLFLKIGVEVTFIN